MAQTPEGARKTAAKKLGLTLDAYEEKLANGQKHCTKCKDWKPRSSFNVDVSRHDGLGAKCRQCNSRGNYPDETSTSERIKAGWVRRKPTFIPPMKGKRMSEESRRKMSLAKIGKSNTYLLGKKRKKHTTETRTKISESLRKVVARGPAHYAYSHGKHQRDLCDRRTVEYKRWRDAVYARDGYTCQHCGDDRGGNLQAHHIKSFAAHVDLRFVVENGITLCHPCHEKVHLKPIPTKIDLRRRKKHVS